MVVFSSAAGAILWTDPTLIPARRTRDPLFRSPTELKCTSTVRPRTNWKLLNRRYSRSEVARATTMMTMTLMILLALTAIFCPDPFSALDEMLVDRGGLLERFLAPRRGR